MASEILPKMDGFVRVVPILGWLPHYEAGWFHADVIAGLTLWGILVLEGIAYAAMAGAPVQADFTHSWAPLLSTPFWEQRGRRSRPRPRGPRS